MLARITSKNQITIPKLIAETLGISKGDVLDVIIEKGHLVMIPKEVIVEDKYPQEDLEAAEKILSQGRKGDVVFENSDEMLAFLRNGHRRETK